MGILAHTRCAGACVALGYVRSSAANARHAGTAAQVELWGDMVGVRRFDRWPPRV